MRATCLPSFPPAFPLSLPRSCPFYPFKLRTTTTDDLARYCATAGVGWLVGTYVRALGSLPSFLSSFLPAAAPQFASARMQSAPRLPAPSLPSLPPRCPVQLS